MEEIKNTEQLSFSEADKVSDPLSQEILGQCQEEQESSSIGKFKDAASLLKAYNSLEKEFTKKSQRLAEVLKNETGEQKEFTPSKEQSSSDTVFTKTQEDMTSVSLEENKSNWKTHAKDFLDAHEDARPLAREMSRILMNDKALAASPNALEYAYQLAKASNQKDTATLLSDKDFIRDNILSNQFIRDEFLKDYLTSVKSGAKVPSLISGVTADVSLTKPAKGPTTIKEASLVLKKLLENK